MFFSPSPEFLSFALAQLEILPVLDYSGCRKVHSFPPPYGLGKAVALPKIRSPHNGEGYALIERQRMFLPQLGKVRMGVKLI